MVKDHCSFCNETKERKKKCRSSLFAYIKNCFVSLFFSFMLSLLIFHFGQDSANWNLAHTEKSECVRWWFEGQQTNAQCRIWPFLFCCCCCSMCHFNSFIMQQHKYLWFVFYMPMCWHVQNKTTILLVCSPLTTHLLPKRQWREANRQANQHIGFNPLVSMQKKKKHRTHTQFIDERQTDQKSICIHEYGHQIQCMLAVLMVADKIQWIC